MSTRENQARVLILGLEASLADELGAILRRRHAVYTAPLRSVTVALASAERLEADVVFCTAERHQYMALLEEIRERRESLPVIIASRTAEVADWLDALEAGAADYCAAPFEAAHVEWIVSAALRASPRRHLRAAG